MLVKHLNSYSNSSQKLPKSSQIAINLNKQRIELACQIRDAWQKMGMQAEGPDKGSVSDLQLLSI